MTYVLTVTVNSGKQARLITALLDNRRAATIEKSVLFPIKTSLTWRAGARGSFHEDRAEPVDLLFFTPSQLDPVQVAKLTKGILLALEKTGVRPMEWGVAKLIR